MNSMSKETEKLYFLKNGIEISSEDNKECKTNEYSEDNENDESVSREGSVSSKTSKQLNIVVRTESEANEDQIYSNEKEKPEYFINKKINRKVQNECNEITNNFVCWKNSNKIKTESVPKNDFSDYVSDFQKIEVGKKKQTKTKIQNNSKTNSTREKTHLLQKNEQKIINESIHKIIKQMVEISVTKNSSFINRYFSFPKIMDFSLKIKSVIKNTMKNELFASLMVLKNKSIARTKTNNLLKNVGFNRTHATQKLSNRQEFANKSCHSILRKNGNESKTKKSNELTKNQNNEFQIHSNSKNGETEKPNKNESQNQHYFKKTDKEKIVNFRNKEDLKTQKETVVFSNGESNVKMVENEPNNDELMLKLSDNDVSEFNSIDFCNVTKTSETENHKTNKHKTDAITTKTNNLKNQSEILQNRTDNKVLNLAISSKKFKFPKLTEKPVISNNDFGEVQEIEKHKKKQPKEQKSKTTISEKVNEVNQGLSVLNFNLVENESNKKNSSYLKKDEHLESETKTPKDTKRVLKLDQKGCNFKTILENKNTEESKLKPYRKNTSWKSGEINPINSISQRKLIDENEQDKTDEKESKEEKSSNNNSQLERMKMSLLDSQNKFGEKKKLKNNKESQKKNEIKASLNHQISENKKTDKEKQKIQKTGKEKADSKNQPQNDKNKIKKEQNISLVGISQNDKNSNAEKKKSTEKLTKITKISRWNDEPEIEINLNKTNSEADKNSKNANEIKSKGKQDNFVAPMCQYIKAIDADVTTYKSGLKMTQETIEIASEIRIDQKNVCFTNQNNKPSHYGNQPGKRFWDREHMNRGNNANDCRNHAFAINSNEFQQNANFQYAFNGKGNTETNLTHQMNYNGVFNNSKQRENNLANSHHGKNLQNSEFRKFENMPNMAFFKSENDFEQKKTSFEIIDKVEFLKPDQIQLNHMGASTTRNVSIIKPSEMQIESKLTSESEIQKKTIKKNKLSKFRSKAIYEFHPTSETIVKLESDTSNGDAEPDDNNRDRACGDFVTNYNHMALGNHRWNSQMHHNNGNQAETGFNMEEQHRNQRYSEGTNCGFENEFTRNQKQTYNMNKEIHDDSNGTYRHNYRFERNNWQSSQFKKNVQSNLNRYFTGFNKTDELSGNLVIDHLISKQNQETELVSQIDKHQNQNQELSETLNSGLDLSNQTHEQTDVYTKQRNIQNNNFISFQMKHQKIIHKKEQYSDQGTLINEQIDSHSELALESTGYQKPNNESNFKSEFAFDSFNFCNISSFAISQSMDSLELISTNNAYTQTDEVAALNELDIDKTDETSLRQRVNKIKNKILNKHITEIHSEVSQYNKKLHSARCQIIENIKKVVEISYNNNQISIAAYGSFETGLLTPFSDVDLAIKGCEMIDKSEATKVLELLEYNLKLSSFVRKSVLILSSTVPLLKIECESDLFDQKSKQNLIKIDITVSLDEKINLENTAFRTTSYIQKSIESFKSFFINITLLKLILSNSGYGNSYTGLIIRWFKLIRSFAPLQRLYRNKLVS